ncbi:MAG: GntP family permease [Ekhidna sp.]|nr:GntP family permease [Ekhidna sp.]
MSLGVLLIIILTTILLIILGVNKFNQHPLLMLILGSLLVGTLAGMEMEELISLITSGFGSILQGIGLIVVFGSIIGLLIEQSGALNVIAYHIVKLLGAKRLVTALGVLGALVSIPVFCDSGFIILSGLSKSLSNRENRAILHLSLASGLIITHTLIPPTPGPLVVAGNLGMADAIGLMMVMGFIVTIPVLGVSIYFSKRQGKNITLEEDEQQEKLEPAMSLLAAIHPILVPILLIAAASVVNLMRVEAAWLVVLGNPNIALAAGVVLGIIQVSYKYTIKAQKPLITKAVEQAGPIVLITGAGGAFGAVLKATPLTELIKETFGSNLDSIPLILFMSYLIAALLKTSQGSSTSALVIASAIMAPILASLSGISTFQYVLVALATGGGAMTVSHANDSYFWVVTQFSGFSMKQGYRGLTIITFMQGLTCLASVFLLYFISQFF